MQAEFGGDPLWRGEAEHQRLAAETAAEHGDRQADQQHRHHRVARHQAAHQHVDGEHRQHQQRLRRQRAEHLGAEAEQDAGLHAGGDGARQARDDAVEGPADADQQQDQVGDQVGPHRLLQPQRRQGRDQQRGARNRPGDHHRHAVAQAEQPAKHRAAQGDGPDPGRQQGMGQAGGFGGVKHDHQGAGVGNHRRDAAGDDGGQGTVLEQVFHGTSRDGGGHLMGWPDGAVTPAPPQPNHDAGRWPGARPWPARQSRRGWRRR
ncbi:hypothetical protein D3C76_1012450 [compost metagenome]